MASGRSTGLPNEQTPLLRDSQTAVDHHHVAHEEGRSASQAQQEKQRLPATSLKLWLLILAYSSLLFLFSSNATGITTMYAAIAETLEAYQNAATWMTASYMVGRTD